MLFALLITVSAFDRAAVVEPSGVLLEQTLRQEQSLNASQEDSTTTATTSASDHCALFGSAGYSTVGCGKCAASCNPYETLANLEADVDQEFDLSDKVLCPGKCTADESCKAISVNKDGKCELHYDIPLGARFGTDPKAGCHDQGGDAREWVCMTRDSESNGVKEMLEIGSGSCSHHDVADDKDVDMVLIKEDTALNTAAGLSGLKTSCKSACLNDATCFSISLGRRSAFKPGHTCGDQGESVCKMYRKKANHVKVAKNTLRHGLCPKDSHDSACTAPTTTGCTWEIESPSCMVKSFGQAKRSLHRGEGYCITNTETLPATTSTSDFTTAKGCQDSCKALNDQNAGSCKGGSWGTTDQAGRDKFCDLFSEAVVAGDTWQLGEKYCADVCGGSLTACSCTDTPERARVPGFNDVACCSGCVTCTTKYASQCFAYEEA